MKPFKEYFNEAYDPANLYNADTSEHIPYDQLHRIGPQIMVNYFNNVISDAKKLNTLATITKHSDENRNVTHIVVAFGSDHHYETQFGQRHAMSPLSGFHVYTPDSRNVNTGVRYIGGLNHNGNPSSSMSKDTEETVRDAIYNHGLTPHYYSPSRRTLWQHHIDMANRSTKQADVFSIHPIA